MTKVKVPFLLTILCNINIFGQGPTIVSWIQNPNGNTGFGGFITNVKKVQYTNTDVYVSTNSVASWIPLGYDWPNNPWSPQAQNFVFKITLNPTEKTTNKIITPYGHIGIWTNGVSIYNAKDAKSYNDSNKWFQNAFYFEHLDMETFDTCSGHPNNKYEYHLHVNPRCLYNSKDSSKHSPIIGYAFDGFPIYGAYAFTNIDGTGKIKRMNSSYKIRNITNRQTLPNGTNLSAKYYGPAISTYPLGAYIEDFEYVAGTGDLDENNGRFCKTPEYPNGIYAYFVTLDANLNPAFPYVLGTYFHGNLQQGNTGPNSGFNVVPANASVYIAANNLNNTNFIQPIKIFPNPAKDFFIFSLPNQNSSILFDVKIVDNTGKIIEKGVAFSNMDYNYNCSKLGNGMYTITFKNGTTFYSKKVLIQH